MNMVSNYLGRAAKTFGSSPARGPRQAKHGRGPAKASPSDELESPVLVAWVPGLLDLKGGDGLAQSRCLRLKRGCGRGSFLD